MTNSQFRFSALVATLPRRVFAPLSRFGIGIETPFLTSPPTCRAVAPQGLKPPKGGNPQSAIRNPQLQSHPVKASQTRSKCFSYSIVQARLSLPSPYVVGSQAQCPTNGGSPQRPILRPRQNPLLQSNPVKASQTPFSLSPLVFSLSTCFHLIPLISTSRTAIGPFSTPTPALPMESGPLTA
jgi:hypothetical protein